MPAPAPTGLKARFVADGCIHPVPIMPVEEATGHLHRLEEAEARHGPLHFVIKPYLFLTTANEIGRHPAVLDAVEALIGPDILMWDSSYVIKEPNSGGHIAWHQDLTYWGLDGDRLATLWIALTEVTVENGCMRYVPGSHRLGKLNHVDDSNDPNNLLHRKQKLSGFDPSDAVDILLAPGEASFHHGWVVHGSAPNTSNIRRVGLTVQYAAPSMRQTVIDNESATLVRGEDRYGHFVPEPICMVDFDPAAVAFQKQAEDFKHKVYDTAK